MNREMSKSSTADRAKRRQGGRRVRRALRKSNAGARPVPVRPGFEGGRYRPLSEAEVNTIHRSALSVLEDSGMGEVPAVVVERALDAGAAIVGSKLEDEALGKLDAAARAACNPIDDKRGTVAYRTKVAGVLARRAAAIAYERAGSK